MQATHDNLYRDDALAQTQRGKTALIGGLGVAIGLVLGLGLGVGAGANLNALGVVGATRTACITPPLSARARFLACSMTEADDIPGPEELEAMLARQRARGAELKWGTP